ncbi:MAG: hypothetical protein HC867_07470 [Bacteroidia bacterium]|nr:hypothetical protein [Bacteroidia bacterium]
METRFVHSEFAGGMSFTADIYGHKIIVDAKPDEGGEDSGPGPKTLMLASLAGCTGMDVVALLKKCGLNILIFPLMLPHCKLMNIPKSMQRPSLFTASG